MPSVLSDADRQTVKRAVPKSGNKIHAVGVARLYVAHPNRQRWTYTGLQGAAVLANDLIGNTFWIKIVDISVSHRPRAKVEAVLMFEVLQPANRGVIWDQEIYDPFYYNQDRVFFHSFELEECLAGLSVQEEDGRAGEEREQRNPDHTVSGQRRRTPAGCHPSGDFSSKSAKQPAPWTSAVCVLCTIPQCPSRHASSGATSTTNGQRLDEHGGSGSGGSVVAEHAR